MENLHSYETYLDRYNIIVSSLTEVSQGASGRRSATNKHYWASVIFTHLCGVSVSLLLLLPKSPRVKAEFEHWDFSGIAALGRQIAECYFTFFYLCVDETTPEEWDCRWNMFNLHDCITRKKIFDSMGIDQNEVENFKTQAEELRTRLISNKCFVSFDTKKQKELLTGKKLFLLTHDELITRMGGSSSSFRGIYRLLSAYVHSSPFSFYRTGENNRGRGLENSTDKGYVVMTLALLEDFLIRSIKEMELLFPGCTDKISQECRALVSEN